MNDMTKKDALLEIGCEELPVDYIAPAMQSMMKNAKTKLQAARLSFSDISCEATSRRLVLLIKDLDGEQPTVQKEVFGPKTSIAYKSDGSLAPAGEGFLRKCGITQDQIGVKDERLFAVIEENGKPTGEILNGLFFEIIKEIPFPKSMRWESSGTRFARPVRWILALLGGDTIDVRFADVQSGDETMLHPLHSTRWEKVKNISVYRDVLEKGIVTLSVHQRREKLREKLQHAATECGGHLVADDELLDMVTMMCEFPGVVSGSIDARFMQIPREIITTAMREHQRYFAVEDDRGCLMPFFLAVHDNPLADAKTIQPGCEKVLLARLKDAEFFFREDMKVKLADLVPKLERVRWVKGLGTLMDKTSRLEDLCGELAEFVNSDVKDIVQQAAHLAKADLITNMVQEKEFNSLQGTMGMFYAKAQGVNRTVAEAVGEHYLPRWADDALPKTDAGRILALADRFDHVTGCWGAGFAPTGAKDPYALRRAMQGIIAITLQGGYRYSMTRILQRCIGNFPTLKSDADKILGEIIRFLQGRLETELASRDMQPDLIQAVLGVWWDDISELVKRAEAIHKLRNKKDFNATITTFSRVVNILPKDTPRRIAPETSPLTVTAELFTDDAEKELFEIFGTMGQEIEACSAAGDFVLAFQKLSDMKSQVDRFFDQVLVMDKNEQIRRNRLNLLGNLARTIWRLADFSKIVITE